MFCSFFISISGAAIVGIFLSCNFGKGNLYCIFQSHAELCISWFLFHCMLLEKQLWQRPYDVRPLQPYEFCFSIIFCLSCRYFWSDLLWQHQDKDCSTKEPYSSGNKISGYLPCGITSPSFQDVLLWKNTNYNNKEKKLNGAYIKFQIAESCNSYSLLSSWTDQNWCFSS